MTITSFSFIFWKITLMKRLIVIFIMLAITTAAAPANVMIHNNNQDNDYSMSITYRVCHFNSQGITIFCDEQSSIVLPKNEYFKIETDGMLIIYNVLLIHNMTKVKITESDYMQYPFLNIQSTGCFLDMRKTASSSPLGGILELNNLHSPYIVCQQHIQYWS